MSPRGVKESVRKVLRGRRWGLKGGLICTDGKGFMGCSQRKGEAKDPEREMGCSSRQEAWGKRSTQGQATSSTERGLPWPA